MGETVSETNDFFRLLKTAFYYKKKLTSTSKFALIYDKPLQV